MVIEIHYSYIFIIIGGDKMNVVKHYITLDTIKVSDFGDKKIYPLKILTATIEDSQIKNQRPFAFLKESDDVFLGYENIDLSTYMNGKSERELNCGLKEIKLDAEVHKNKKEVKILNESRTIREYFIDTKDDSDFPIIYVSRMPVHVEADLLQYNEIKHHRFDFNDGMQYHNINVTYKCFIKLLSRKEFDTMDVDKSKYQPSPMHVLNFINMLFKGIHDVIFVDSEN